MTTAVEIAAPKSGGSGQGKPRHVAAADEARPAQDNLRGHLYRGSIRLVGLLLVDGAVIGLVRGVLQAVRGGLVGQGPASVANDVMPLGAISGAQLAVAIIVANFFLGCYRAGDRWRDPVRLLSAAGVGVLLATYSDLWHGDAAIVAARGMLTWVVLGPVLVGARSVVNLAARRFFMNGLRHRVLEVTGDGIRDRAPDLGPSYEWVASLSSADLPRYMDRMERWLEGGVDTILVRGQVPGDRFGDLTDFALTHGCRLLCMPPTARLLGIDSKRVWMDGHPLSELTTPGMRASHLVLKRALDITVSLLLMAVLAIPLLLVALWVRLDSPGPVLFKQRRPGFQGKSFPMFKFRSMRSDAEEVLKANSELYELFLQNDCKLPEDIDPRLTRSGRFIRKTSLDELPQLINVLRGDMSLVGPRPLVGPELENYGGRVPTLLSVKPGMTGRWQVSGRSRVGYPERAEMDLDYVRNWSFLGDLWILTLTPAAVLLRRGAH